MEDSLDRLVNESSPRMLLRNFMEVMEPNDTPVPLRNRAAAMKERAPQGMLSSSKQRSRPSRSIKGGENMQVEVLRHQSGQPSFIDQTLNVSVIQGINQTYANIAAPDSDNSSVNSSIDLEKGARFRKQKMRKLETAHLPTEIITRSKKKKRKKTVVQSYDTPVTFTTEEAVPRQDFITEETMVQEMQNVEAQDKLKWHSTKAGTAGEKIHSMHPDAISSKERAEHPVHASANSPDVSSISTMSTRSDGTYDFSADYDDTLLNVMETKKRFGNRITSRKLNLPSLIEALQAKQKSASLVTVADIIDTLNTPDIQVTNPEEALQEPQEASDEESSKLHSPSQNVSNDAILPPLSFRDSETSRSTILREAHFSNMENTSKILFHFEESDDDMGQDQLPKTPALLEDEDLEVDVQRSASPYQRKSLGQDFRSLDQISGSTSTAPTPTSLLSRDSVSPAAKTTTPTYSSPRKSMSQATVATTPAYLSSRKSVDQVTTATAIKTPASSSLRRSVGQITDTTTPTRSSPRRNVSQIIATKSTPRSVDQVTDVTTMKIPTKSSPRSMVQVIASESPPPRSAGLVTDVSTSKIPTRSSARKSVGQVNASESPPGSVGLVTDVSTLKTPTRSSPRKSVSQVSASKSSPRRSLSYVSTSKSSQRSVGQVNSSKSPPRNVGLVSASMSSPRSVGRISASKSSPRRADQVPDATTMKTPTKSPLRRSVGRNSASKSSPRSVGYVGATKSTPLRSLVQVNDVTATKAPTKSTPKSMGQVTDISMTKTPTRSSSRSVGQTIASNTTPLKSTPRSGGQNISSKSSSSNVVQGMDDSTSRTPTLSSLRSVDQVTDVTTTKTPTRSSRIVDQVNAGITTSTMSSPRQSLGQNISSVLVSPQKASVVDNTVMVGSLGRSRNAQARQRDATAMMSVASVAEASDETEKEKSPSLPEDDAENTSLSDFENEFSLIPVTVRPSFGYMRDTHMVGEEEVETSRETSPLNMEALPSLQETSTKQQPTAPSSTARVRQMTMREFLEQLKTKPVQPPLTKPKPLLPTLYGTGEPSTSQSKPQQRQNRKTKGKKKQLPASLPKRLTKEMFTHFAKCRVSKGALTSVMKITEIFWENLTKDVCAMQIARKRPTKSIQHHDVEKLMERQGLTASKESLDALVEQLLPMEMWSYFKTFPEPAQNPFPSFTGPFFNP